MKQGDAIVISHNAASMSDRNDDSYSLLKAEKNKDPSRSRKKQKKQKKKKKQERKVAKVGSNSFHSPDTDSSSSASLGSSSEDFGSESDFSGDESLASTGSEFASSSGDDSGSESNLGKKRKKKEGKAKSEATQRALLRRRRHKKNAAIKIQAFARGCLCRQEVGLMVAELISQLQVQVGSSTSAIDSTVDESKPKMTAAGSTSGGASVTSDSSMNEFVLNAYLNCTFGEDSDDNVHLDQSNNNNDEIIDGLCFPSTLPSNFDDEDTKSKSTSSLNENQDSDENISFKEKISMFGQATSRPTWFGLAKEVVKSSTVKEQKHSEDNISSKGGLDFKGKLSTFGQKSNIQPSWTGRAQQTQSSTINSENKKIDDHDSNDNISFKEKLNMFGQKTDSQLSSTGLSKHPSNSTLSSEGKGSDDQASNGSISFKDKIDMFGQKSSAKIGPKSHSGTPPLPTSRKFSPKRPAGTLSIPTSKKVPTQVEIQAESSEGSLSMDDEIIPIPSNHTEPAMETPLPPPIPNATSANTSLSPGELKIVARIKELGSKKDAAENDKMVGIPRGKPPPEFVEQRSVQAVRSSFELGNKDKNAPMTQDFETLNAPKQRASASIVQKIKQLGVDIPPVAPSSFEKEVEESKMIDFAAHQYLLHESAARIQALARGFLYRKKDLESTMVVLRWLQEQRPGEDLSAESVTEDREFDGKEAMNVIREDSETDGNDEETEHAIERVERSSDDEDDTQELEEMGGSSNNEFEEPLSFAERQLAFQQKAGNDLSDNMGLVGSVEEASAQRAARRRRLNGSATKIQAVVRGHLARSIDYHAMVYAVKWLQGHRRVDDLEKNEGGGYRASLVDAVSAAAGAKALASAQRRIQNAAIQMQSLARGYLCRKFDMEALTSTLLWLREYKRLHALSTEIEVVEPKEEHLETIWTFLQDNSERTAGSESDKTNTSNTGLLHEPGHAEGKENNEASKRTYDVPKLLETWEWLKKKELSAQHVKNSESKDQTKEAQQGKPIKRKTSPKIEELVCLHNWMVQNRFTTGKMIDLNLLGTDDSIEAGGAVTTGNPRTRVFYDASVEAGGTDVDPNSNKPRVFYDTSVTAGGTGTGPNSNKPHVFYDTSITAGGDGIGGKSGPKYLYDNSIESGGAPSKPKTDELHVAPIDVTKMVDLWNWLEDNQTDMRRFLEPQGGQSDAGIHYIDEDLSGAYKRNRRYHDDTRNGAGVQYIDEDLSGAYDGNRRYDDEAKKGADVQYIDEDLSGAYKGDRRYDDEGRKGAGIQYIDEDLSGAYDGNRRYDDEGRKGAGIQYIDEDLSGAYDGNRRPDEEAKRGAGVQYIDEDLSGAYRRNRRYDDAAKSGAGIQFIDEDLSGAYDGNRRYDDEARKAAGVQYIDEDLSGAYKQKNSEEQQVKPSPYDMMNYWKFSQLYSGSLARKGRDEGADRGEGSLADENMNAEAAKTPSDLSEEEKTGETKHNAQSSWAQSPSMNEMMNALSWLDKQGVNLAEVKKTETIPEDPDDNEVEEKPEETEEITIDSPGPSSKDMADTLDWLTKKGFSSVQKEKTNDLVSSSSSGNTEETKDNIQSEVAELEKRSGPPASNNMIDALRWLESRGFEANKPRIGNSKFSPDHNTDGARKTEGSVPNENSLTNEGNSVPVKDVLYELSWLHTHGFDLDRASGDASQQGTTSVTPEKEMGNHTGTDGKSKNRDDAPTMKEMMDALNWVESKKPKTKAEPKLVPSVDEANDTMPTQPTKILSDDTSTKPDSTASKDMEFALKWLEKRGITASLQDKSTPSGHAKTESRKKTKSVKQRPSSRMSTRNMTSALDWLQKRNFSVINKKKNLDREKKAASQEPSAQDLKTALHSLKEKEGKTDVAGPSIRDMEDALKWMKIQEGAKKPKRALPKKVADEDPMKDPNWMGEGEEAKTSFVGDVSDDSEDNLDNIESKKSKSGENTKKREKTKLEPKKTRSSSKSKKKRGSSRDKKKSSSRTSSRRTSKAGKEVTVKKDAEKRASSRLSGSEMERTLKWLQNKAGSATVKQDSPEPFSPKNQPKKKEKKDASESGMDYKNALSWLHTKKADNVEDITYFKKLDAMLPKKGSQSIEARAREIAKAMKWVRKQETKGNSKTQKDDPIDTTEKESSAVDPKLINDGVHNFHSGKSAIEDVPKDTNTNQPKVASEIRQEEEIAIERTPSDNEPKKKEKAEMTQAELDCENALTWLKTKQAESVEDVTYFRKLDAILPKKASQTLEARAKEMAKAMKWVKKQGILGGPKKDVDDEAGKQSESTSEPKGKIGSTKQKNTSSDPTVARNRKETKVSKDLGDPVNKSPVRSPTRGKISLMTMTKKNVKDVTSVKDSLKSLRRQKKNVSSKDTSEKKAVISSPSNTNDRDFTNAIAWLESKNPEGLEDANFFKKLDSMLPKKQGQSTEDRAKEIVKALSWVRKTQGQETDQAYNKRDPKDAKKQKAKSDWKKLKKSLKGKPKQEKAKEKARTVAPTIMQDDDTDGSGKKGVASNDDRGQTGDRVKSSKDRDLENALDFIKIKEEGGDFMQVEDASSFKKLDNMLPKKASQKPEDRAKEMVKMLAWMKKKNLNAVNR